MPDKALVGVIVQSITQAKAGKSRSYTNLGTLYEPLYSMLWIYKSKRLTTVLEFVWNLLTRLLYVLENLR